MTRVLSTLSCSTQAQVKPLLAEVLQERRMPESFRGLSGDSTAIAYLLSADMLLKTDYREISTPGLPNLFTWYAYGYFCLHRNLWGESGPTGSILEFETFMLQSFDTIKADSKFNGLVAKFHYLKSKRRISRRALRDYFNSSLVPCKTSDDISKYLDALILLIWTLVIIKHLRSEEYVVEEISLLSTAIEFRY